MNAPTRRGGGGPPTEISVQSDADLLARLHEACTGDGWDAPAMARLLGSPATIAFCAARGAEPCGLVLVRRTAEDCEILTIGVTPAMRNQGVGAALLDAACDWGSRIGARRVVLEVAGDNRAALRLYDNAGFGRCGRRRGYYAGGRGGGPRRDALILRRGLSRRGGGIESEPE